MALTTINSASNGARQSGNKHLTKEGLDNIPKVWYNKDTNKRGDNNNEHQPEEEEHRQQLQTYQEGNEEESLSEG
jgi:hypothetical protein